MSKYAFAIKNAVDLLKKARHDADRFNQKGNDALTWTYAAIDYIQTAWHLADWIARETGNTKKAVRNDIDKLCAGLYLLAGDLANGQKHWQRDGSNPPQAVAKTSAPGARRRLSPIGLPMNYRETPFVIDNNGRKIYAQILIRDTLDAIEKHMKSLGLV